LIPQDIENSPVVVAVDTFHALDSQAMPSRFLLQELLAMPYGRLAVATKAPAVANGGLAMPDGRLAVANGAPGTSTEALGRSTGRLAVATEALAVANGGLAKPDGRLAMANGTPGTSAEALGVSTGRLAVATASDGGGEDRMTRFPGLPALFFRRLRLFGDRAVEPKTSRRIS
jgi:hypothetical protein